MVGDSGGLHFDFHAEALQTSKAALLHGPPQEAPPALDALAREGARRMLMAALDAEVTAYIERVADGRDADGCRLVVRNGQTRDAHRDLLGGHVEGAGAAGEPGGHGDCAWAAGLPRPAPR